jgi:purine-binding chemotaxis protein CheW
MHDSAAIRHCTFRVGDHRLAVPADAVAEVLSARPVARVPLAPAGVLGLVHLRGRIVPILDPAVRLGIAAAADRPAAAHVVLRAADDAWCGLNVDEMLDVIDIPPAAVEHPAAADPDAPLAGVFAAATGLVHVLDFRRMIHLPQRSRPQAS